MRESPLGRALTRIGGIYFSYLLWFFLFQLIILTFITYFLISPSSRVPKLQEISEVVLSNQIPVAAVGAALFVTFLTLIRPYLVRDARQDLLHWDELRRFYFPAMLGGTVLGAGLTLALFLSGHYRFLGTTLHFEEAVSIIAGVLAKSSMLALLVYCEEYLFRKKLLEAVRRHVPDLYAAAFCAILFCGAKALQFQLGVMQVTTLFLAGLWLGLKACADRQFQGGAGFWTAFLVLLHAILGLPILGNDANGIFLIKYSSTTEAIWSAWGADSRTTLFLTGGIGGPLSSFAVQIILLMQSIRILVKNHGIGRILKNAHD